MNKYLISLFLLLLLSSCGVWVSDTNTKEAVENQGYSNVELVDKDIFFINLHGCSNNDEAHYDVLATNALGKRVELEVCVGWPFKGVTIRSK